MGQNTQAVQAHWMVGGKHFTLNQLLQSPGSIFLTEQCFRSFGVFTIPTELTDRNSQRAN